MANYTIKFSDCLMQMYINKHMTEQEQIDNQYDFSKIYTETNPINIVADVRSDFFNFEYPLFDSNHKEELEKKILYHYWDYEIGEETFAKFKFNINKTLNEVMPYYNQLYEVYSKKFNFDENIDYKETLEGETSNTANNTSRNTLTSDTEDNQTDTYTDRLRESDTPQGQLLDVEDEKYISKYNYNNGTTDSEKTNHMTSLNSITAGSTGSGTSESERIVKGTNSRLSRAKMLQDYLNIIQNIDLQVVESLKSCFMLLI